MGCNVEKAKVKIADIINSGMKSNSIASSEKAMKQAEQFANVLDKIKSNYVLNKDAKQDIEQDASENITNNIEQDIESKTPYFDALPSYKDKQRNMIYAGIGSRETPAEVLKEMTNIAKWLNEKQYKLQTGATFKGKEEGADKAFSDGSSNKELFRPESANDITISIAKEIHPAPQNLKPGGLKLMARNTNQIFGKDLDTPVDFVLFYAEETNTIRPKGGTGQAVEMARKKGIPTINMSNKDWKKELVKVLNNRGTEENIQKPNFENVSKQKEPAIKSGSDEKVPAKQTENDDIFIFYPEYFSNYIKSVTNPKIKYDPYITIDYLLGISNKNGWYHDDSNEIFLPETDINILNDYIEKLYENNYDEIFKRSTSEEEYGMFEKEISIFDAISNLGYSKKDVINKIKKTSDNLLFKLESTMLHELVHSVILPTYHSNLKSNNQSIKNIKKQYENCIKLRDSGKIKDGYWSTNINEFIAESMSNYDFIEDLASISVDGEPVKIIKNSILGNLIKAISSLLGFENTNSVYHHLLKSLTEIIELRKNNPNFTASNFNIKKEIKSSMDNKTTENVDIISTDVTKINIKDELLGFVASGASAYDNNVDMDFFGNFIETIKKVSANLEKYGLDKNIEFRQHKMATDRYTRGTYTFGEDVAKDNSYLSGSDSGYMFEIDGGVVDIYYGKGFYNETEDGIVQNELRQDISLSTNPELIMHEILHSMIEKAYDQDKELNRALFLLKEQVMKKISYKDLLGKDESEATNAEIQLAKDIYAYMHNPTEFLAYAATNQNVFLAVKDLTIKNTLIGKFEPKRGDTIGKFKQFLNRFIDAINKIYTSMTTGESAKTEFDKILNGLIEVNTKIEIGAIDIKMEKEFKPYAAFGLGEKFKKTNDWMLEAEKGAFSKLKDVWSADTVRNKAEGAGRFIESIGNWRGLQWLRDTRLISDLVTDMAEDTTSDGVAWFYEAVRHIKGTREKDKLDFATVMKKKVGAEFGEFSKEERSAVTFMLQGDWKALGVSLSEYKDMLTDESKVESRISDLKSQIKHSEYINQSAMLGYYLVNGEAKGSATMKSAYQIVHRFHTGKESSPLQSEIDTDSMIKLVDELSSLYAIKYTEKSIKDNIVSAIERDADVVSFGSDTYYAYRLKEQNGQLAMFGKYMDKGYVRKSGEVDMKFDIIPESKLIRNSKISSLNHKIIRELPEVQNNMHDAGLNNSFEKYYLVVERDMDPARTQGVLDDISIIEQGQELASFTAGKSIDYSDMKSYTTRRFGAYEKTYLNKPIDDSLEAMRDRKNYSISNIDINGNIVGYAEPVSEADKVNHGRINNDIADVLGNTASHIQSKEKALLNNQNFIELLIADSNNNIGTPGYVFISPDSREVELQKYWAMIPDYSRSFIEHETAVKGLWVKLSRINNIVGYKDVSISNMKLFGLKLEDYPEWQKSIKIVEHTWKEIASAYKEIIVKLMPNVILSNATSNMFVALRHGIGPMEYAKGFRKAWSELSEYIELNEQLVSLKIDRDIGKKGLSPKIAELEKRLERNGMHPLIKDGHFSMIFEDLDKDSTSKSTHLKDVSSAKIEQWFGKNVADNLEEFRQNIYITKETRGHQAIEKLTLFNDIINKKIIMDKMTQDINEINFATPEAKEAAMIDMINYLDQLFVNYSYLTNKYIKWASDMNIILFIKYFLRAGKAALNMTRRQPLGSLVAESFDTFLWNIPDPIDQYMTPVSTVSGKIGLSPIDMIGEVLFPRIITIMP